MALIPPHYLDAVVAIGVGDDPEERKWIGTGFLLWPVIRRKRRGAEPLLHLLDQSVEDTELFALTSRVKRGGDAPYLSRVSFRVTVPSVVTSL